MQNINQTIQKMFDCDQNLNENIMFFLKIIFLNYKFREKNQSKFICQPSSNTFLNNKNLNEQCQPIFTQYNHNDYSFKNF